MPGIKTLDEMNIEELKKHREVLRNEEYDNECDYEFTRLEISEINKLIEVKTLEVVMATLERAQSVDQNGNHLEVLEELENKETTIKEIVIGYMGFLQFWISEEEDKKRKKMFQSWLDELKIIAT